ncbi:MAG: RT0821/Lpp0805 family surface protein [Cohaesibacter sp.]|jgi:surface antigen|nr:RT0821/Lpp0805 family surface protein [Cohaesibacter sp.]MCV6574632.1 RT0821/Lpp0805 family surface protein [Cohaesibacter sp.]MCV6603280.1 RT0821/Lpp0805 family surface protein [Cohaesibacter sp.]
MKFKSMAVVAIVGLALAGCQGTGPKQTFGGLAGAVAGGAIGNQFGSGEGKVAATVAGAFLGALAGSQIGQLLDERDRQLSYGAEQNALEYGRSGAPVEWRNPDSGRYGQVVPAQPRTVNNLTCRDYTHTIYIDGQPQTARGQACRQSDGTWRPVS